MRNLCRISVSAALVVLTVAAFKPTCSGQEPVPLAPEAVPRTGTFYVLSDIKTAGRLLLAPLPCAPEQGIFYLASQYRTNIFLVDGRASPQLDTDLLAALAELRACLEAASAVSTEAVSAQMSLWSEQSEGEGGPGLDWLTYGTNDLWMEAGLTNVESASLLSITIHPPETDTCWDVFGTTNLAMNGWLNLTNWAWLLRTDIGETNVVLTNLWTDMGFFRLGTMLDSDLDGLTDAYELLTSHTERFNPDSDGDGVSDYDELLAGTDPWVANPAFPSGPLSIDRCPP